jgi:hypothetical protein
MAMLPYELEVDIFNKAIIKIVIASAIALFPDNVLQDSFSWAGDRAHRTC